MGLLRRLCSQGNPQHHQPQPDGEQAESARNREGRLDCDLDIGRLGIVERPQRAITRDAKGNGVALVVNADNKVEQRVVSTLRTIGDKWLIDNGLRAGERVVVEGVQKVQPGMTVKPIEAGATGEQRTADAVSR